MKSRTVLSLVLAGSSLLVASPSNAQRRPVGPQGNVVERTEDTTERVDDRFDRREILSINDEWNRSVARGGRAAEVNADNRLSRYLTRELVESRRELDRRVAEQNRSAREANRTGRPDDQRDLADDQQDTARTIQQIQRTLDIAQELQRMQPGFDQGTATPPMYQRKRDLLAELVQLANIAIGQDRQEVQEDRQETREDVEERLLPRRR